MVIRPKWIGHDIETVGLGTFSRGYFRVLVGRTRGLWSNGLSVNESTTW